MVSATLGHNPQILKIAGRMSAVLLLLALSVGRLIAQQDSVLHPLTADQVMERIAAMNRERADALHDYTSVQVYHLELNGVIHKTADMVAKMTYHSPDQKDFTIVSEGGSDIMRSRVLKAILAAEKEALLKENRERSAFNQENYEVKLVGVEGSPEPKSYILEATPRTKNKFLFKGKVWVDAKDFAFTRVECQPVKNPSWWTKKNDITKVYQKLGDFWLPAHTQSITEVRIFGHTVLDVEYRDYHFIDARKLATVARSRTASPSPTPR